MEADLGGGVEADLGDVVVQARLLADLGGVVGRPRP